MGTSSSACGCTRREDQELGFDVAPPARDDDAVEAVSRQAPWNKRKAPPLLDESSLLSGPEHLDVESLASLGDEALVVDLRGADFFGGHILQAVRLPFEEVLEKPDSLVKIRQQLSPGKKCIVFCCMHGEPRARLCAEKFCADLLEERRAGGADDSLRVGVLIGGLQAWLNHFAGKSIQSASHYLEKFDPEAWLQTDSGSWSHVSVTSLDDVLTTWSSNARISQTLLKAKPLLAHSGTMTEKAVNEVARWQQLHAESAALLPEDIAIDHEEQLGHGASSVVLKATHRASGQPLAVKVISVDDPETRRQLFNSLSVFTGAVNRGATEGIMQLRGLFAESRKVFIVLEFMDVGPISRLLDLQTSVSATPGLPEPLLKHVMRQVVVGLETLHSQKVLHRDLKPDNILVHSSGRACLADFGLSVYLEEVEPGQLSRTNSFVGTSGYISPQRAKGNPYSTKEDVWAIGVVLYELAAGSHPLGDSSSAGELFGSLWEKVEEDDGAIAGIALPEGRSFSKDLRSVVDGCLRKRPSRRLSASDLAQHPFWKSDAFASQSVWDKWYSSIRK